MPESDTNWHAVKGPLLESLVCRQKLYTLLALFFASERFADQCDDSHTCQFRALLDDHEESLITQLLIESAVLIRVKDDLFVQQRGISTEANRTMVGRFGAPAEKPLSSELSVREACNKIIHAKLINFDVSREDQWRSRHLNPIIYLYGEQRKSDWKAELDVIKWVEFGSAVFA